MQVIFSQNEVKFTRSKQSKILDQLDEFSTYCFQIFEEKSSVILENTKIKFTKPEQMSFFLPLVLETMLDQVSNSLNLVD